jgi:DNA-binding transcriptional MerR regulator
MGDDQKAGIGVSVAARELQVSEGTIRRLCSTGIVTAARDSANRRQLTAAQIETLRAYLQQNRNRAA